MKKNRGLVLGLEKEKIAHFRGKFHRNPAQNGSRMTARNHQKIFFFRGSPQNIIISGSTAVWSLWHAPFFHI
jgi:hypothetical protein